jgi:alpha-beta hydrolase superfamily lysophospholipase
MLTRVVCVDRESIATIAMVHGFAENSMTSFLETAMHHALNGFEVVLADMKGFGYASGIRGAKFTSHDWHE